MTTPARLYQNISTAHDNPSVTHSCETTRSLNTPPSLENCMSRRGRFISTYSDGATQTSVEMIRHSRNFVYRHANFSTLFTAFSADAQLLSRETCSSYISVSIQDKDFSASLTNGDQLVITGAGGSLAFTLTPVPDEPNRYTLEFNAFHPVFREPNPDPQNLNLPNRSDVDLIRQTDGHWRAHYPDRDTNAVTMAHILNVIEEEIGRIDGRLANSATSR